LQWNTIRIIDFQQFVCSQLRCFVRHAGCRGQAGWWRHHSELAMAENIRIGNR